MEVEYRQPQVINENRKGKVVDQSRSDQIGRIGLCQMNCNLGYCDMSRWSGEKDFNFDTTFWRAPNS